jgi:DNA-binding GntR family transcriptional regulator
MEASTARWRGGCVIADDQDMPRGPRRPSETVAASLRERIEAGEWAPGDQLPTVAELSEHYQVARSAVARALRMLEDDGLVEVIARWGTFRR